MTEYAECMRWAAAMDEVADVLEVIGRRNLARLARLARDHFASGQKARGQVLVSELGKQLDGLPGVFERLRQFFHDQGVNGAH